MAVPHGAPVRMSSLVDFNLAEGGSILVEVDDARGPVTRGGRAGAMVTEAGETLEDALARLGPAVRGIVRQLRESAEWPGEIEVEFSIRLSADAGVIITRTGGEANFRIAMRWVRESPR